MGHDPDSRILERYYLDKMSTLNVGAAGIGEYDHIAEGSVPMASDYNLAIRTLGAEPRKVMSKILSVAPWLQAMPTIHGRMQGRGKFTTGESVVLPCKHYGMSSTR